MNVVILVKKIIEIPPDLKKKLSFMSFSKGIFFISEAKNNYENESIQSH